MLGRGRRRDPGDPGQLAGGERLAAAQRVEHRGPRGVGDQRGDGREVHADSVARRRFGRGRSVPGDTAGHAHAEDVAYIAANFVPLTDERVRAEIAAGRLPKPAYVLDDGTEMVAPDHLALAERAGGVGALREWFEARAPGEWDDYLSGQYAVCLRASRPRRSGARAS